MSDNHGAGIKTFSSGFGFGDYDETRFATMVADRYDTDHKVFTFDSNLLASMGDLAWYYGEPFADSSALVTYALSRETRRSVTVALTGDGADETLLGYARYFNFGEMRRSKPPRGARRLGELYLPAPRGEDEKVAATDAYGFMLERFREGQKLAGYGTAMLPHLGHCSYERLLPYFMDLMPEETAARSPVDLSADAAQRDRRLPRADTRAERRERRTYWNWLRKEIWTPRGKVSPSRLEALADERAQSKLHLVIKT